MPDVSIRVEGLDVLMDNLRADRLLAAGLREGFDKAGQGLRTSALKRAPVDRGALRASIKAHVDPSPLPTFVELRAGDAAPYAPYMEYGTGLIHDHPSWPRKRHVIPPGALDAWAKRKGVDAGAVSQAVMRRGGLKPRRFLRGALEDNQERVVRVVAGAVRKHLRG